MPQVARGELDGIGGSIVVVDVIRAFSTAAYAFGSEHCDPTDIELAARVDAVDFAMEAERTGEGLRLTPRRR